MWPTKHSWDEEVLLGNLSGLIVTTGSFYIEEEGDEDLREEGRGQTQVIWWGHKSRRRDGSKKMDMDTDSCVLEPQGRN